MSCCLEPYERARLGDAPAVQTIVERLRPRLARMAAYYARRAGEDADDLLQEAWCAVLEALPALDLAIGSPEQHLLQRARWRVLDTIKRNRIRRCVPLEASPRAALAASSHDDSHGRAHVAAFADALKPTQRTVLRCLMGGLTWRETGDRLGCTSANVAYYVRQIRRRYEEWSDGGGE